MPGGIVENATARYQPQGGIVGRAVNSSRREMGFEVLTHAGDPENGRHPVGERHVDGVSRTQGPEAEENRRPLIAIDVTFDNRRADLARRRRVFVPRGLTRARDQRRHLDRAVGVESEVQEVGGHADGRNIDGHGHGAPQPGPVTGRCDGPRRRGGWLRGVLLRRSTAPTVPVPARMSRTPRIPAIRAQGLIDLGGRAYPPSGHEATTRNPAIRGHLAPANAASLPPAPRRSTEVA